MSNVFQRFLDLIPKQSEFVGTIKSEDHPNYKVLVVDGSGLVACTSVTKFNQGARVFVQDQQITRAALQGEVIQIEV
ncbi:hypothetical protein KTI55_01650 [Acinetobacter ursingii]|uniref:hypothetical protein n=1 Tax=Acinetobacter ursingii TaxID=108980 RepID=UPI0021CDAFEA|nr:hypothetical protein [Acinetobacter ursingii]MCU4495278.1 hypothetical protein [Acinetobacter ursingii]